MRRPTLCIALSMPLLAGTAGQAQLPPLGDDFQVSTQDTSGYYLNIDPALAAGPDGGFFVVWASEPATWQGRTFAAGGTPGTEFTIDTSGGYRTPARTPAISADPDGDFVVVWSNFVAGGAPTLPGIKGQRFAGDGTSLGEGFVASDSFLSSNFRPDVAKGTDGGFVVVWSGYDVTEGSDLSLDIRGRRFDANGTAISDVFRVNTETAGTQLNAAIAEGPGGDFMVAWSLQGTTAADNSGTSIRGRLFDAGGGAAAEDFAVNTSTAGNQLSPAVAAAPDGRFLVVWQSDTSSGSDTSLSSIQGQLFAPDATPLGGEFQINTYSTGRQTSPAVAAGPRGGFVVVWGSAGSSGSDDAAGSVQGQALAADASPLGAEFQVNTTTGGYQFSPSVSVGRGGEAVIVWANRESEPGSDETSIRGRRFELPPPTSACGDSTVLCLGEGERFEVTVDWADFTGNSGPALPVAGARTPESGLFYFFDLGNWEVLIKILDGCGFNGHFWVFAAATTNVAYTITVTDTVSGLVRTYSNPLGTAAAAITDTSAFAACAPE